MVVFAASRRSAQRDQIAVLRLEVEARDQTRPAAPQLDPGECASGFIASPSSSAAPALRASAASGSDIARYNAAQIAPGMTQLPMFVAKICVLLGQLDHRQHGHERRVLQHRHEVVRHRREREPETPAVLE
jgi:hypothetical protein